ncbi:MAG TPA: PAS domain S-box protein, partial [Pyrinomonadaceae bacterium]|nr:PAS domain S-box protein [Pyrinomonadaceae bacterium]
YRIRRVNPSLCAALGYEADELLKRKFTEFTFPDDIPRDKELGERLFRGEIPSYRLEKRFVTKQGILAWLDFTSLLVQDRRGKPLYGLAMVEDITDRKHTQEALRLSEERYRSFIVNSSEGIWCFEIENPIDTTLPADEQLRLLRDNGYLAECNDEFARMYGRHRAEDILGSRFGALAKISQPPVEVSLKALIENDYRLRNWPTEVVTRDNNRKYLSTSLLGIVVNRMLLRVWSVQTDQTEQRRIADGLAESHQRLRALSAHLQSVREKERADLARELHDSLGQSLTSIKISLSGLQKTLKSGSSRISTSVTRRFTEITEILGDTIGAVKAIATELRPGVLDQLGLPAAIEWQCREFTRRSGIACDFKVPRRKLVLDPEVSTALFRVLQEALTNVARHSEATRATTVLSAGKLGASLTVSDNGRGITQDEINAPDSLGLLGMRERMETIGGELSIDGKPGKGTVVSARTHGRKEADSKKLNGRRTHHR